MSIQSEQDKQTLVACHKRFTVCNDAYDSAKSQLAQSIRELESVSIYAEVSSDAEKAVIESAKKKIGYTEEVANIPGVL